MTTHIGAGIWRVADPKITLASAASLLLGLAAAARDGPLDWGWLVLTVLGIFCIEAAKNASGEVFDFDSGDDQAVAPEDRSPFSGGKRVLVDGLMTRRQTLLAAAIFYAFGAAAGLAIVFWREPRVLPLGLLGVLLAWGYHAPPLKLSYRGLGEVAVALAYGPVIACGAYLVQRHTLAPTLLLSVPLGLAIGAFLFVNEFPDARADAQAGKRTWVVRLGRRRASHVFRALVLAPHVLLVCLIPAAGLPWTSLAGLAGLPHAAAAARRVLRDLENTPQLVPAQAWTLLSFLLLAAGAGLGLLLDR